MKTSANDMAFPVSPTQESGMQGEYGLTKREHFAGLAMQGLLALPVPELDSNISCYDVADRCVDMADSLIAALNRRQQ